ncbi:MAG: cellulose biosynthesis cyclic di-GMP-binding regulatory protein BcsB [Pelolinea sp.]|jgi:hypothetical protein|nr:cellulose biosynthesis cyclic di-GMP-binding regulatory protein BcsB [Pelolinea sp.]
MFKPKPKFFIPFLFFCILLIVQPVKAQSGWNTIPHAQNVELSLSDLGFEDSIVLQGPYQEVSASFSLPPDWNLTSPATLNLRLYSEFQSLFEALTNQESSTATAGMEGYLKITLNGNTITETTLNENVESVLSITIDSEYFLEDSKENLFTISWDSASACQYSVTTTLSIDPSSKINFPMETKAVKTDLSAFPAPFYTPHALKTYPIALVIPDQPDEDDLSALLAVSAGLGKQTEGAAQYDIVPMSEVNVAAFGNEHLIVIGKTDELAEFFQKKMDNPELLSLLESSPAGNGLLSLQVSPWNSGRALLLVTGENGEALRKASAVIAANDFLPYANGNTAIIQNIIDPSEKAQFQVDVPLSDLTQESLAMNTLGETTIRIPFDVPGDTQISSEAFLELYFRHSQLINYLQSNLTVSLNGKMVSNIRFSDTSAQDGLARIIFPPDTIRPLKNILEFTFNIASQDVCADERSGNYWISIFKESYLHLPPVLEISQEQTSYTLKDIPDALLNDHTLSTLTFLADQNDPESWKYASRLAFELGTFTRSDIVQPNAVFAGTAEGLQGKTTLAIGMTSEIPFSSGINAALPLPFKEDGSIQDTTLNGIQFQMQADQPFGVLEITSQSDDQSLLFSILGNSTDGLQSAFQTAQTRLLHEDGPSANVEIIDNSNISHSYYIKPSLPAAGNEETRENWLQRMISPTAEKTVIYLLVGCTLLTAAFILWIIADNARAKKKSK